ncbi:MAG: transposase [Bacteroidales bacterium]|nr:transposase [Bacteroidales bacterium]
MSEKYKIHDHDKPYFITMTVVGWIDVFTRKNHKLLIVNSLKHCQKYKGLEIFAWCLMPSHFHMIARAGAKQSLSEILRDFKKYTSKKIVDQIIEEHESRRNWMLAYFKHSGKYIKRIQEYKVWQDGNHAEIIYSPAFFYNKLNYIHKNPVKDMTVSREEDYWFSSARNYAERDYLLEVILESSQLITY